MTDILLIHGALGAGEQLAPLAPHLGGSRRVHTVELPGHGATSFDGTFSIPAFVDSVADFLSASGIEAVSIFGYSMGGYIALALAARSPERVRAVATLGTKLDWSPEIARRETSRLDATTIRAKVPRFAEALEVRHRAAGGWETLLARTSALMTALGDAPAIDASTLATIACPTRLMVGDRDATVSVDETRDAARRLARGELAVLPATPHPFEQVRVPLLATLLAEFFDAVG